LGLQQYAIFFSVSSKAVGQKSKMRETLLKAPFVELLIEVSGRFNFGLVLTVRSVFDLERFFDFVTTESNLEIRDLHLQARTGWHYFGVKYLSKGIAPTPIQIVPSGKVQELSREEIKLLHAYAASSDGNRSQIAKALGVPATTIQYQLEKLRKSGVLLGVRYQVSSEIAGHYPYRVLLSTSHPLSSHRIKIFNWAKTNPLVVSMMHGVGPWQYELRIEAPGTSAVSSLVDDILESFSDFIENAEVVPVAKVLKMQLAPDLGLFTKG
jgi:DNA-binding Lrp family transcriptional regulator